MFTERTEFLISAQARAINLCAELRYIPFPPFPPYFPFS